MYREKELYREGNNKEAYSTKDVREKEVYRERDIRDKEVFKDKDAYREKELFRDREHYREREMYRDNATFRDVQRSRELYREKEMYKDRDMPREPYVNRERQYNKYVEGDRKHQEADRIESRLRLLSEEGRSNHTNEKENRDKTSGDKELEDLRSRLLSKRISKELQGQDTSKISDVSDRDSFKNERQSTLDKHQQERRKKLLQAGKDPLQIF